MTVEVVHVRVAEVKCYKLQEVRGIIFPIIKSTCWLCKSNSIIKMVDAENFLITEETGNPDIQVGFAMEFRENDSRSYISHKEMLRWGLDKKELKEIALSNLQSHLEKEMGKGKSIVRHTQSGLVFCNQLNDFSASLALLNDIAAIAQLPPKEIVAVVLRSDLLVLCSSASKAGICILGELILRRGTNSFSAKPFRIIKGEFLPYEAKLDDEYAVPFDQEHLKQLKGAFCKDQCRK